MIPSPQLKLDSINLSREKTKPPTPEIPGFPLDAPSKKIVVEGELIHHDLNASTFPHTHQEGELTGLIHIVFLNPDRQEPINIVIAEDRDEGDVNLPVD